MKKKYLRSIATHCLSVAMCVSLLTVSGCDDDNEIAEDGQLVSSTTTESSTSDDVFYDNGYEYVDMGLSVLWATENVDSSSYYPFGTNSTVDSYTSEYCTTHQLSITETEIKGSSDYDAARKNMGGSWRTPTKKEMEELCDTANCTWSWSSSEGGYYVTSKSTEGQIFLPAAGYKDGSATNDSDHGNYWTCTPDATYDNTTAYYLHFYNDGNDVIEFKSQSRYCGRLIRAVSVYPEE